MFDGFGERLKKSLKNAGYTHKKATDELGLSKNAISNYVGGRIPESKTLYRLSQLCGKSVEYLLTGEETINNFKLTLEEQALVKQYRELTEKNKGKAEQFIDTKLEEQKKQEVKRDVKSSTSSNIKTS